MPQQVGPKVRLIREGSLRLKATDWENRRNALVTF